MHRVEKGICELSLMWDTTLEPKLFQVPIGLNCNRQHHLLSHWFALSMSCLLDRVCCATTLPIHSSKVCLKTSTQRILHFPFLLLLLQSEKPAAAEPPIRCCSVPLLLRLLEPPPSVAHPISSRNTSPTR